LIEIARFVLFNIVHTDGNTDSIPNHNGIAEIDLTSFQHCGNVSKLQFFKMTAIPGKTTILTEITVIKIFSQNRISRELHFLLNPAYMLLGSSH